MENAGGRSRNVLFLAFLGVYFIVMSSAQLSEAAYGPLKGTQKTNAYATMLYMGTPRDYEFYVAARVMLGTLVRLQVDADLVVIASATVPQHWQKTLIDEGAKVVVVNDIQNPYKAEHHFEKRFEFTLNKVYAWSLTEYQRVVMLDVDNLFLRAPDELFQCGQFCAAFINPCIFHTGLFVLQPSNETFSNMMLDISGRKANRDGLDQGFLGSQFSDLLDRPMFYPPVNGSRLDGLFRLPLGYQMDASFFYLKLKWRIPCGPNSVITFPSVPMLKPWYWWSWPTLPLGLSWHEKRVATIGYETETPVLIVESFFYVVTMLLAMIIRQRCVAAEKNSIKSCFGRGPCAEKKLWYPWALKLAVLASVAISFLIPAYVIPTTVHPFMGWGLFLLGSLSLLTVVINMFQLPVLPVLTPWIGGIGALLVLASPFYKNGIMRGVGIGVYTALATPFLWWAIQKVCAAVNVRTHWDSPLMAWTGVRSEPASETVMKLC
ncbi:hypothetical protein M758_4G060600 [Ceratodon purpureus]|uniref:Glucuronosyltransferase PGSIP8 n=1 Tax=Ceratodon purpureus TaxID=3225 RepID=A0A8T0I770_CERPU|nr:hypothetical protein KC19_4G057900 [Ceratodon purpureus]KAG0618398.1 hypothetical protein M758_4G060600 [Ceratodon purpureus]